MSSDVLPVYVIVPVPVDGAVYVTGIVFCVGLPAAKLVMLPGATGVSTV